LLVGSDDGFLLLLAQIRKELLKAGELVIRCTTRNVAQKTSPPACLTR